VSAAVRAPLNLNAHCRAVFFVPCENYVHLIEQCCLIYPLKLNCVTTKYYRDIFCATYKASYMSDTYFNFALFYFQALFTTWPAYVHFDGPAHIIIYCVCCKYLLLSALRMTSSFSIYVCTFISVKLFN